MTQDASVPETKGTPEEKIFLVEDNKANLQILYELLETTGCRLLVAMTCALFRSLPEQHGAPDQILAAINRTLSRYSWMTSISTAFWPWRID